MMQELNLQVLQCGSAPHNLPYRRNCDMTDRVLLNAAREASKNAYVPYSKFHVGAALGSTICAERTALVKAVSLTTDRRAAPETKTSSVWSNPYGGCFFLFYRALDLIISPILFRI